LKSAVFQIFEDHDIVSADDLRDKTKASKVLSSEDKRINVFRIFWTRL